MQKGIRTVLTATVIALGSGWTAAQTVMPRAAELRSDTFALTKGSSVIASRDAKRPTGFPGASPQAREVISDLEEALRIIGDNYSGGMRSDLLFRGAIEGALSSLDPHSAFLSADDLDELLTEQHSEYFGIGTTITTYGIGDGRETYILSVTPGSPAYLAGIRFGDLLISVDGKAVNGLDSTRVRDLVRGPVGTATTLEIVKCSTGKNETVTLQRARVAQPSVPDSYLIRPGVGYIALTEGFSETTAFELKSAIRSLRREGMQSLVIDMRGNPGGLVSQAVKVSEIFLPYGKVIVSQKGRHGYDNALWKSSNPNPESLPLILVVDRLTASAAEIVAGALQDHERALIVGEKTFGKGLVQSVIDLPQGSGLALTTARYYTPAGRTLQRDYSQIGLYDYFLRETRGFSPIAGTVGAQLPGMPTKLLVQGDGIQPDILVGRGPSAALPPAVDRRLFEFARGIIFRKADSKALILTKHNWYDIRLPDPLIDEFLESLPITIEGAPKRAEVEVRLRHLLATADVGAIKAERVFIEGDPVVLRSISETETARTFAALLLDSAKRK